ncbi:ATP-dependent RNA helicase [Handroanthus impetiginosus]|uniref:RNA helicase n=1 Tax=Handroanthus impetiginosus TaxID=429701 RepID=A0A2G9GWS5_9LAMI|nr:ATP-dependent RNA helicase [Handroanthus impetiginosus]
MPSIVVSESQSPEKKKSMKKVEAPEIMEDSSPAERKSKKEKKSNKKTKLTSGPDPDDSNTDNYDKKRKDLKRKALEDDTEEERSQTSLETGEPMNSSKKKKKMKVGENEKKEEEQNPNALSNFRISQPLRDALKEKGIEALFPIQAMTFDTIFDGSDLVGRARTGQGKTLAFVLPILESLTNGQTKASRKTGYGRPPSVLVLLPTRELATQVFSDFEVYGGALGLKSCCLYGGTPYQPQQVQLKRGVDIVIGTPGRIKDHIERGNIDFSALKFRVLDEADEMLRMGFVEDVELILGKVEDASKVQTLLFSATLPDWVKRIAARFLKPDKKTADLVGNEKMKASTSVRHIVIPCSASARSQLIPDIISCYSSGGRTIIFTETKDSASTLAGLLPGARALHGDIQQATREVTLSGFRSGKFSTLVATNVAARGLDIDDVQLIIQCEPPRDVEAYIHRSGRTGRAGKTGVAVMLYDPRKSNFSRIERESGVKFEHLSAPQPADVAKAAGAEAAEKITEISDSVIPVFKAAAEELLNSSELSPSELLAKALAKAAGYTEIKSRSLLSSMENYVSVLLECGRPVYTPSFVYGVLRRFLPEEKVESIKGLALTADGNGAVFDVATEDLDSFLTGSKNAGGVKIEVVKSLPCLQEREQARGGRFGGGGRGKFSGGRGGGGFSNRRDGKFSGGRGGGGSRGGGRGRGNYRREW